MKKSFIVPLVLIAFYIFTMSVYVWNGGYSQQQIIPNILYIISVVMSVAAGAYATTIYGMHTPRGTAFGFITTALMLWLIGESMWLYYYAIGVDPFPSPADVFYLLAYPAFFLGMLKEIQSMKFRWSSVSATLKISLGSLFAIGVGVFFYFGVLPSIDTNIDVVTNLIASAYGAGDIILTTIALLLIVLINEFSAGKISLSWKYLLVGLVLTLIGDLGFMFWTDIYEEGKQLAIVLDGIWIASYLAFAYSFFVAVALVENLQTRLKQ